MRYCGECSHWEKLVGTCESYGVCRVKMDSMRLTVPAMAILRKYASCGFGSLSPSASADSCEHYKAGGDA